MGNSRPKFRLFFKNFDYFSKISIIFQKFRFFSNAIAFRSYFGRFLCKSGLVIFWKKNWRHLRFPKKRMKRLPLKFSFYRRTKWQKYCPYYKKRRRTAIDIFQKKSTMLVNYYKTSSKCQKKIIWPNYLKMTWALSPFFVGKYKKFKRYIFLKLLPQRVFIFYITVLIQAIFYM